MNRCLPTRISINSSSVICSCFYVRASISSSEKSSDQNDVASLLSTSDSSFLNTFFSSPFALLGLNPYSSSSGSVTIVLLFSSSSSRFSIQILLPSCGPCISLKQSMLAFFLTNQLFPDLFNGLSFIIEVCIDLNLPIACVIYLLQFLLTAP